METGEWLTLEELAENLKLSRTKLYRIAQEGRIPASEIGAQWHFNRKEIDDLVISQRPGGASQGNENGNDGEGA